MVWKVCATGVNCLLKQGVVFHDALHGFMVGRGTRADTLEANMDKQLSGLAYEPLFQVSLDIRKVYDSLYRG